MARFTRRLTKAKNCPLCASGTEADYKDVAILRRFLSERGKILSRAKTGLCARHQRQVTRAVKKARVVALLPFVVS